MSAVVEPIDLSTADENSLRAYYELESAIDRVFMPNDPPVPFEWYAAEWRIVSKNWQAKRWVLRDGDQLLGTAGTELDMVHNLENSEAWVYLVPEVRGTGQGRKLAAALFDWLGDNGRTRISFRMPEGSPLSELAKRGGTRDVLRMKRSRLRPGDVDRSLMESWVAKAAERAGDYELLFMETPVPEEHLEAICVVNDVMNDAPFEDYVHEEEKTTPENWRELERVLTERGDKLLNYVARHRETGEFVGFTNLNVASLWPEQSFIWNTGVHSDHRNKGLGRWIKASMTLHVLDHYPLIERMDTWNAGSNEPMLNINVAMGFRPVLVQVSWQGELAKLRQNLGV